MNQLDLSYYLRNVLENDRLFQILPAPLLFERSGCYLHISTMPNSLS